MKLFTKYPDMPEAEQVMQTVYGWKDNYFKTSYHYMKLYHWIVKDQSGILNWILETLPGQRSYISFRNHRCDNMNLSGFQHFEEEAVNFGVELIQAAYWYRQGKLSDEALLKIIEDCNYSGVLMS